MPSPTTSKLLQLSKRIELPPNCLFYVDPNLDRGRSKLTDLAGIYGISKPRDNLLLSPAMNTDTNSDGVVDNFISGKDAGVTGAWALDINSQKLSILSSTGGGSVWALQQYMSVSAGEVISVSAESKVEITNGVIRSLILIEWMNGTTSNGTNQSSLNSNTAFSHITVTATAPAGTTSAKIYFRCYTNAAGAQGSAWFNTALLVKGSTAQQISDPHQDLTIIDAEAWGPNATIVRSLNGSSDYMYCGNHSNIDIITATPQKPLSVFGVVNVDTNITGSGYILCKNGALATDVQYGYFYAIDNTIKVWLNGGERSASGVVITRGKYQFVGFNWDGSSIKIYVNGNVVKTSAYSATLTSAANFAIGRRVATAYAKGLFGIQLITQSPAQDVINWAKKIKLFERYGIAA